MTSFVLLRLLVLSGITAATCRAFTILPRQHPINQALKKETIGMISQNSAAALAASSGTDATSTTWQAVNGLGIIASRYDAFLVDQWGVMHDGKKPYPGAVECIDRLAAAGKKIVLLSNSSKRKSAALNNLERMGFATGGILDVVTSGQVAWDGLQQRIAEPFKSLGNKCLVFGNGDDDAEYVSSCGCILAEATDADFILARGSFVVMGSNGVRRYSPTIMTGEGKQETEDSMRVMLERGAKMLVTNPASGNKPRDFPVLRRTFLNDQDFLRPGTNDPMPGLIGQAYADMGGTVHYVGKPHSAVYEACFQALRGDGMIEAKEQSTAAEPPHLAVAAVGDSLPHDILGSLRAGMGSVFVAGGVHFEELGVEQGQGGVPSNEAYSAAFEKHLEGAGMPTYAVPSFKW